MKKKILAFTLTLILCVTVAAPVAMAQLDLESGLEQTGQGIYQGDAAPDSNALPKIIGNIINVALSFLGVVMVILVIYGGFLYMTAGGNDDQTGKAKKYIINAIIGLIIILLAYAITGFVITSLIDAAGNA